MNYKFQSKGVCKDSISYGIKGEYLEDGVTGATLTFSGGIMSITIPAPEDDGWNYFRSEELLLNLVKEALEILDKQRDEHEILQNSQYREKCYKILESRLPSMKTGSVKALRRLIVDDALPIGQSASGKNDLLALIDDRLKPAVGSGN